MAIGAELRFPKSAITLSRQLFAAAPLKRPMLQAIANGLSVAQLRCEFSAQRTI
jgi:hypothetical protein